jgi:NarL family two-component system response regulator LiaR
MPDQPKIRVLIVDDHAIVRQGLRTFLELQDDLSVVGEAPNGRAAVTLAAQQRPDVVLMDLVMPELDGIAATRQVREACPSAQVIALTSFSEDDRIIPAIQAGACSYVLKDISPEALVEVVRAAARGEARLHPDVARKLMNQVARPPAAAQGMEELTGREVEVARLVARGLSNREIAGAMVISEKTVKTHISSIFSKLGLEDRTQLAIYALKHGLGEMK